MNKMFTWFFIGNYTHNCEECVNPTEISHVLINQAEIFIFWSVPSYSTAGGYRRFDVSKEYDPTPSSRLTLKLKLVPQNVII